MRPEGWENMLASYIANSADLPFVWGESDCALWVCGWIKMLTGTDYAEPFRGRYDSEQGAKAALAELGFESLEDLASERLIETPIRFAQRGDIVLSPTGALGICNGIKSHFLSREGLIPIATFSCLKAWRA